MKLFKKASITDKIGEEIVDNILEIGLTILLIMSGVNYFNLDNKWSEAMIMLGSKVGLGSSENEIMMMVNTVQSTFPFNFLQAHQTWTLVIGIAMCIAGATIKILTLKSKEEFIKDLGKILLVPGIVGVVAIVFIQIMTINSVNDLLTRAQLVTTQLAFSKASSGIMIWNMMGLLFLIGVFSLIFGALIYYVTKSLGKKPLVLYLFGRFLVIVGWFGLIYYALIRVFAIDVIAQSLYGENILKLFAFSWYIARSTFIVSVLMFALGMTLYSYGKKEVRMKKKRAFMEAKKHHMMMVAYGHEPEQRPQQHMPQHHAQPQMQHMQHQPMYHPVHQPQNTQQNLHHYNK